MKNNQPIAHRFNESFCATLLTLLFIAASTDVFAAPGDLDPSWGKGGVVITSFTDESGHNIPT